MNCRLLSTVPLGQKQHDNRAWLSAFSSRCAIRGSLPAIQQMHPQLVCESRWHHPQINASQNADYRIKSTGQIKRRSTDSLTATEDRKTVTTGQHVCLFANNCLPNVSYSVPSLRSLAHARAVVKPHCAKRKSKQPQEPSVLAKVGGCPASTAARKSPESTCPMSQSTRSMARVLSTNDESSTLLSYSLLSRRKTSTTNHHDFFKEKMLLKT